MKHKWAKEIKAWADGAEIESKGCLEDEYGWVNDKTPEWHEHMHYRITALNHSLKKNIHCKSCGQFLHEKQIEIKEPQYLYVYYNINSLNYELDARDYLKNPYLKLIGKIKLEDE